MWSTLLSVVALCLLGTAKVSGDGVMGHLQWCGPLCMCKDYGRTEVSCFSRGDIYQLLALKRMKIVKLERADWKLEDQLFWCNNTCLCFQNNEHKVFQCAEEDTLKNFISERIGDQYFYTEGEVSDQEMSEVEHTTVSERRKKNRRNRKPRKRVKNKQVRQRVEVTELPTTTSTFAFYPTTTSTTTTQMSYTTTPTTTTTHQPETPRRTTTTHIPDVVYTSSKAPPVNRYPGWSFVTPYPTIVLQTSGEEEHLTTKRPTYNSVAQTTQPTTTSTTTTTESSMPMENMAYEKRYEYPVEEREEEVHLIEDAELLPKQEAVAASPAVTAMQPPTRRQPFPPTVSSHAATREVETLAPKVSAVLEVPLQRKTVASEVSQDLDDLENTVMEIKSDVVLNQRILLVTVAVAGIAMLGVLVLAIHSCMVSKRQSAAAAAAEDRRPKDPSKEDNHVTKVNLEEAW